MGLFCSCWCCGDEENGLQYNKLRPLLPTAESKDDNETGSGEDRVQQKVLLHDSFSSSSSTTASVSGQRNIVNEPLVLDIDDELHGQCLQQEHENEDNDNSLYEEGYHGVSAVHKNVMSADTTNLSRQHLSTTNKPATTFGTEKQKYNSTIPKDKNTHSSSTSATRKNIDKMNESIENYLKQQQPIPPNRTLTPPSSTTKSKEKNPKNEKSNVLLAVECNKKTNALSSSASSSGTSTRSFGRGRPHTLIEGQTASFECIICFELFTPTNPPIQTRCRCGVYKRLHLQCIESWKVMKGRAECPICQSEIETLGM
eukprot:g2981.t1